MNNKTIQELLSCAKEIIAALTGIVKEVDELIVRLGLLALTLFSLWILLTEKANSHATPVIAPAIHSPSVAPKVPNDSETKRAVATTTN